MKLGIIMTSIGNFGENGFYNVQELGLAKELDKYFDEIIIYKAITGEQCESSKNIENYKNITMKTLIMKKIGVNGIISIANLDEMLDVIFYASADTQLSVLKVYQWALKNKIRFIPHIGVIESHSTSFIKKIIMDILFQRNLRVYKKVQCLVKTPQVKENLMLRGVNNISVAPVGLDVSLLHQDYSNHAVNNLKIKHGYGATDKVILFIGRLTKEKQPVRMIEIFKELYEKDNVYRLLMVGKGELKQEVEEKICKFGLNNNITMIEQIPNVDIWELYRIADAFVNLNEQEIFGMAILEAMYYECKVVALNAPGPEFIVEDGVSGYLVNGNKQIIEKIMNSTLDNNRIHNRIVDNFTWENTAEQLKEILEN